MNSKYLLTIIITAVATAGLTEAWHFFAEESKTASVEEQSSIHSPYYGQESRGIKALSQKDVEGLLTGAGTPFGGMAKPAELNGYPGPRHVLDAIEAGEFNVTPEQKDKIAALFEEMRAQAVQVGEKIVATEQELDDAFSGGTITDDYLQEKTVSSANLYGDLRAVHLQYHLAMMDVLTPEQVLAYNELRGYVTGGDPCQSIPAGHDPELWKKHNDCV